MVVVLPLIESVLEACEDEYLTGAVFHLQEGPVKNEKCAIFSKGNTQMLGYK